MGRCRHCDAAHHTKASSICRRSHHGRSYRFPRSVLFADLGPASVPAPNARRFLSSGVSRTTRMTSSIVIRLAQAITRNAAPSDLCSAAKTMIGGKMIALTPVPTQQTANAVACSFVNQRLIKMEMGIIPPRP